MSTLQPDGKHVNTVDQIQGQGKATSITCDKHDIYLVCNKEDVTERGVELFKGRFRFRDRDSEGKSEKGLRGQIKGKKGKMHPSCCKKTQ